MILDQILEKYYQMMLGCPKLLFQYNLFFQIYKIEELKKNNILLMILLKQSLHLSLQAEMLNQDPQLFQIQQVAGSRTKKLIRAVNKKKVPSLNANIQDLNMDSIKSHPHFKRSFQNQFASLQDKEKNEKLNRKQKTMLSSSKSYSKNSSSIEINSRKDHHDKLMGCNNLQEAKLIYQQSQNSVKLIDQIYRRSRLLENEQKIIVEEVEYANEEFSKKLNQVLRDLIIQNLEAHVPESERSNQTSDFTRAKLVPFLQKFLVVKFKHIDKPVQKMGVLQVQPMTCELKKQLSWSQGQHLMKHKFNQIQSQIQFIATILCGDSDLVCMTIHSISSEANLINGFELSPSGPNINQNKKMAGILRKSNDEQNEQEARQHFPITNPRAEKTPSPNSRSNLMLECFNDAMNNQMHMVDSLSSDEILSKSSIDQNEPKQRRKNSKEILKRPHPVNEIHHFKPHPENMSFNDLQISQGQNNDVNFNGSINDLMSPKTSSLLESAHFKQGQHTGNLQESIIQNALSIQQCIGSLELNLETKDQKVDPLSIRYIPKIKKSLNSSSMTSPKNLVFIKNNSFQKSIRSLMHDSLGAGSSKDDNLLGLLEKKAIQPRVSNQTDPFDYRAASWSSPQMVMPLNTSSNQNQLPQEQKSSNQFTGSGFTIQNTGEKIVSDPNNNSSISYHTKRSNKSHHDHHIESGNIHNIPINTTLLQSPNNTFQNGVISQFENKHQRRRKNNVKNLENQYSKSIQQDEAFKDSLQNQKKDDTVKTLHEERIKRPIFLSSNIEDLISNLAFSNRNRYNKRQEYINQIKKLEGNLEQQKLFMNMVIHDLRNPSESIHKGLTQAIEEHQMVINKIFKEAQNLIGNHLAEQLEGQLSSDQNQLDPKNQNKQQLNNLRAGPEYRFQSQEVSRAQIKGQQLQIISPAPQIQDPRRKAPIIKKNQIQDVNEYIDSQKRKFMLINQINSDPIPPLQVGNPVRNQAQSAQQLLKYNILDEEMDEQSNVKKIPESSGNKVFVSKKNGSEIKFVEKIVYKHKDIQQYEKECQTDLSLLEGFSISEEVYKLITQIPAIAKMNFNKKELQGFFINVENYIEITKVLQIPLNLKIPSNILEDLVDFNKSKNEQVQQEVMNRNADSSFDFGSQGISGGGFSNKQSSQIQLLNSSGVLSKKPQDDLRLHQCQNCLLLQSFIVDKLQRFQNANSKLEYYIQNSVNQAHLMNNQIGDLLDLAQLEKSTFSMNQAEFDLVKAIKETFQIVQFQADQKKLKLLINFDTNKPYILQRVTQDKRRVLQALLNFISNSIKFTKIGGFIKVHINVLEHQPIEQEEQKFSNSNKSQQPKRMNSQKFDSSDYKILEKMDDYNLVDQQKYAKIQLVIEDNGVGISKDQQKKLFQDYSKLNEHSKINHKGTGLGLSICKKIVEQMGGKCTTTSVLGSGTKFFITLTTKLVDKVSSSGKLSLQDDIEYFEDFHSYFGKLFDHNKNLKQTDLNKDQLALEQDKEARFETFKFRMISDEDFSGVKSKDQNQQVINRMLKITQTFYVQQRSTLNRKMQINILKLLKPRSDSSLSQVSKSNLSQEEIKMDSSQISSLYNTSKQQINSGQNPDNYKNKAKTKLQNKRKSSIQVTGKQEQHGQPKFKPIDVIGQNRKNMSFLEIFNIQNDNNNSNSMKPISQEEQKSQGMVQQLSVNQSLSASNSIGYAGNAKFSSKFEKSKSKQDSSNRSSIQPQNFNIQSQINKNEQAPIDSFSSHVIRQMNNIQRQIHQSYSHDQSGLMSQEMIIASPQSPNQYLRSEQNQMNQAENYNSRGSLAANMCIYERIVKSYKQRKLRLLVANDDSFQLFIISQQLGMLPNVGIIDQACNGKHALDLVSQNEKVALENGERYYDIIFLDLNMPIQDGYEAQQNICNFYEKLLKESRDLKKLSIKVSDSQSSNQMSKEFVASSIEVEAEQKSSLDFQKSSVGNMWLQDLERIYKVYLETGKNQSQGPEFMDVVEQLDKNGEVSQETKDYQKIRRYIKAHLKNVKYHFLKFLKRPFMFAYSQLVTDEIQQKVIKSGFDGCLEQVTQKTFQDHIMTLVDTSIQKQIQIQLSDVNSDLDSLKRILSENGSGMQSLQNQGSIENMNQNYESGNEFEEEDQHIIQSRSNLNNFTAHYFFENQIQAIQEDISNEDDVSKNSQINQSYKKYNRAYSKFPSIQSVQNKEDEKNCDVSFSSSNKQQKSQALKNIEDQQQFNHMSFGALHMSGPSGTPRNQQKQDQNCAKSDNMFSIEDDKLNIIDHYQDSSVISSSQMLRQGIQREGHLINVESPVGASLNRPWQSSQINSIIQSNPDLLSQQKVFASQPQEQPDNVLARNPQNRSSDAHQSERMPLDGQDQL